MSSKQFKYRVLNREFVEAVQKQGSEHGKFRTYLLFSTGWKPFNRNPSARGCGVFMYLGDSSELFSVHPQALPPPSHSLTEEIFMATQLRVYVSLAHTLAPAGKVHARNAGCSNVDDEAHCNSSLVSNQTGSCCSV